MHSKKTSYKKGQVLLIIIMLFATIITVVTTVSFTTTTETQNTKLEEESQKTLAAAEAGIEKAIAAKIATGNNSDFSGLQLNNLSGIDLSNSRVNVTSNTGQTFVSSLIQKDQQYTFYLADYNQDTSSFSNPYPNPVALYYGSDTPCSSLALEITTVSGLVAPYTITRYISDSSDGGIVTSPEGFASNNVILSCPSAAACTVDTTVFNCQTSNITLVNNTILMMVRPIGARTKLAFRGSHINPALPPQGKFIISEAKSDSGIIKRVQLFQSFPQIPSEFLVTTF